MKTTLQVADVTHLISLAFVELGVPKQCAFRLHATILEHDDVPVAKRYRAQDVIALWIVEQNVVRFYNTCGELVRTMVLD